MAARIQVPAGAKRGEVIAVRVLIEHPMETGYRRNDVGQVVPRNTIREFSCRYNGAEVFSAEMSSGVAANPYLQFYTIAQDSGEFEIHWIDDEGKHGTERQSIIVGT